MKYYSDDFRKWQHKFYNSKQWKDLRNEVRRRKRMTCDVCHRFIRGKSICDHIKEITPENKDSLEVILNFENLQLLCFECHNAKTFGEKINFVIEKRKNVNLF